MGDEGTVDDESTANAAERRRWNDQRWTDAWPAREALTEGATPVLVEALAPQPGERVLDVGSGGGGLTLAVAEAVGPSGSVVGADVSEALTALARRRAASAGAANASFVTADVQTDPVPGGPFDAITSQFGVMFFDEPAVAFANLRAHLRPGGRLVFACWATADRNRWHTGPVLSPFVTPPPAPAPGKSPTGPFTMGDPVATAGLLTGAGFTGVRHVVHETVAEGPAGAVYDESLLDLHGVAPPDLPAVRSAVAEHLSKFHVEDGRYRFPLCFFVFSAANP